MKYEWKFWEELGWAVLVAVVVTLATAFVQFEPSEIADWKSWVVGLIGGVIRASAAVLLAQLKPAN